MLKCQQMIEYQAPRIQIKFEVLSILIWVQTVLIVYQQTIIVTSSKKKDRVKEIIADNVKTYKTNKICLKNNLLRYDTYLSQYRIGSENKHNADVKYFKKI